VAAFREGRARVQEPLGHVVEDVLVFGQEELLEDKADARGPQGRELPIVQEGHVEAGEQHAAIGRPVQRAHQVQQRGLARPGRAYDGKKLPLADGEADASQGLHRRLDRVDLGRSLELEDRRRQL
jgi:hypothetical protein